MPSYIGLKNCPTWYERGVLPCGAHVGHISAWPRRSIYMALNSGPAETNYCSISCWNQEPTVLWNLFSCYLRLALELQCSGDVVLRLLHERLRNGFLSLGRLFNHGKRRKSRL